MSKSLNNIFTLEDLEKKNITPLAYRYWLLTAHYRTLANFTWEAVAGAQTAYRKLVTRFRSLGEGIGQIDQAYKQKFLEATNNDLDFPKALALVWELLIVKSSALNNDNLRATLLDFDKVFGLGLGEVRPLIIPPEVQDLVNQRQAARQTQDWTLADMLRQQIEAKGYRVDDTDKGPKIVLD